MSLVNQQWALVMYNYLGQRIGGIDNAHERTFTFQFNAPQTIQFTLDTQNPATKHILEHKEEAIFVVLWYKNTLCMTTEISGLNLIGGAGSHSLAVTCTETMWTRLMPRLMGKSVAGYKVEAATDKFTIIKKIVEALNGENSGKWSTGITPETNTLGVTATLFAQYKSVQEIIEELGGGSSGFDFWQQSTMNGSPNEYSSGVTGVLHYASLKGSNRCGETINGRASVGISEQAIFEYGYGTKANVASYNWTDDYTLLANSIYVLPSGFPTSNYGAGVNFSDIPSEKAFGYRDAVTSSDISEKPLAETLATNAGEIRKRPRQVFTFVPVPKGEGNTPEFKPSPTSPGRYETGDIIAARVKDYGITLLNGAVRVYGNTIVLDDNGGQTETLLLTINTA